MACGDKATRWIRRCRRTNRNVAESALRSNPRKDQTKRSEKPFLFLNSSSGSRFIPSSFSELMTCHERPSVLGQTIEVARDIFGLYLPLRVRCTHITPVNLAATDNLE